MISIIKFLNESFVMGSRPKKKSSIAMGNVNYMNDPTIEKLKRPKYAQLPKDFLEERFKRRYPDKKKVITKDMEKKSKVKTPSIWNRLKKVIQ